MLIIVAAGATTTTTLLTMTITITINTSITGGPVNSNENPRRTEKSCIHLCLQTLRGSDYYLCPVIL